MLILLKKIKMQILFFLTHNLKIETADILKFKSNIENISYRCIAFLHGKKTKKILFSETEIFKGFIKKKVYPYIESVNYATEKKQPDLLILETLNKALFNEADIAKEKFLSLPVKKKIFWTGENTEFLAHASFDDYCIKDVDLALGYKRLNNKNYLRFPLWIYYIFIDCNSIDEVAIKVDQINNFKPKKTKFCALISRHDNKIEYQSKFKDKEHILNVRSQLYHLLNPIESVSCPGNLFHNDSTLKTEFYDDKQNYLAQFKFNICPENGLGDGYCTEKLFHAFDAGCIPIYWGEYPPEPGCVNQDSFLFFDGKNHDYIFNEVSRLNSNDGLYNAFIARPKLKPETVDFVWNKLVTLEVILKELLNV